MISDWSASSVMNLTAVTGTAGGSTCSMVTLSTHPNQHDYDMLSSIYAHLDSTTTIAARTATASSASDTEVTDDPNSWGVLMRQSANGRSSEYERYHPDGSRTVTHVFWTEEAAARNPGGDHRFDH
jgi:hypothetical protein